MPSGLSAASHGSATASVNPSDPAARASKSTSPTNATSSASTATGYRFDRQSIKHDLRSLLLLLLLAKYNIWKPAILIQNRFKRHVLAKSPPEPNLRCAVLLLYHRQPHLTQAFDKLLTATYLFVGYQFKLCKTTNVNSQ
jgi:hypothetical protein